MKPKARTTEKESKWWHAIQTDGDAKKKKRQTEKQKRNVNEMARRMVVAVVLHIQAFVGVAVRSVCTAVDIMVGS